MPTSSFAATGPRIVAPPFLVATLLGVVLAATAAAPLTAQQGTEPDATVVGSIDARPRPHALAARRDGPVEIDGLLDEEAWAEAPVIDRFVQQQPNEGAPVTERTEVRILYDDQRLYIGAELYDSEPSRIISTTLQRDPNTSQGDTFGFSFDTFRDGENSYVFFINPGGAFRDLQSSDDGRVRNIAWNAVREIRTTVHDRGWTVEVSIPWSSLRFDGSRNEQVWGMHLFRRIRRKNEEATWAPMDRRWSIYDVSRSGTLGGLDRIRPGRNLSLKPYALASRPGGALQTEASSEVDAGIDLKYGITPGLTLDLTLNTDFSQVEADRQQVNLTRFSLFFPEQREFFLENAGIFQFGDRSGGLQRAGASDRDFTLFHSRRIGLTPSGSPLPILGGGRISGTAGPLSVGLLNMQTRSEDDFGSGNFTVARVRAAPSGDLTTGAIVVNRTATSGPSAHHWSYGLDADYTALNDYLLVQSYVAATEGTEPDGTAVARGFAGRVSAAWRGPLWNVVALLRQLGEEFDPQVGFVRRRGVRHAYATVGARPRVSWTGVQELNPFLLTHYFHGLDGGLETREIGGGLGIEFRDGSAADFEFTDRFERVREPFSVGGATVPSGGYSFQEGSVSYNSSGARKLSGRLTLGGGAYYGGDRVSVSGNVTGRFSDRAILNFTAEHNRIDLPGQAAVDAAVYGGQMEFFFSTRLLLSGQIQYNEATGEMISDARLNWIHAPLSDLYLVFTERRDTEGDQVLERLLTLKVTRLFSF